MEDGKTAWDGVRNYQARNFMRDQMSVGDKVLFYHSSCDEVGVVGIAQVASPPYPDESALDMNDSHFDPKSTRSNPIWYVVDMAFVKKFERPLLLSELRNDSQLEGMVLLQTGSRLSVQPVSEKHFEYIIGLTQ
jgi:predicted RNA-binding protein with PUA-like domain